MNFDGGNIMIVAAQLLYHIIIISYDSALQIISCYDI